MENKKILKLLTLFIVFVTMTLTSSKIYAVSLDNNSSNNTKTQDYKTWESLPDEEKNNYIQPLPFSVGFEENNLNENSSNVFNSKLKSGNIPSSYNLANNMAITVRNQMNTPECWAFATTGIVSMNMEKLGIASGFTLLSPRHMDYTTSAYAFTDKTNSRGYNRALTSGANSYIGLAYCTAGYGPVLESDVPFENNTNKVISSKIEGKTATTKVDDYSIYPSIYKEYTSTQVTYTNGLSDTSRVVYGVSDATTQVDSESNVAAIRNQIKQHIMNYGGISTYTKASDPQYFNSNNTAYYCNDSSSLPDHAVTIVGWDDNYAISNFRSSCRPLNKGAYIILNSWGTGYGNTGYYYISYEDSLIEKSLIGVLKTENINYDNIYQYDELGFDTAKTVANGSSEVYISNVFSTKSKNEILNQISVFLAESSDVEIYANVSSDDKTAIKKIKTVEQLEYGYHTITLDTPLKITGDKFVIAAKILNSSSGKAYVPLEMNFASNNQGSNFWDTATGSVGQSYISIDATDWTDINNIASDTNVCLKAFTTNDKRTIEDGIYEINSNLNINKTLDIVGATSDNGGNTQIYQRNGTNAQKFKIKYLDNGYYKIENVNSNKVLDVAGAGKVNGTNVQQYESNGTIAQQWQIKENLDGTYTIISKCNGLCLDIVGANTNDGTNVQVYEGNNTSAQKFIFYNMEKTLDDGVYEINTKLDSSKTLDVEAANRDNGANVQIYESNGTNAQKFRLTYLNNGYYKIENINSNKVLDVAGARKENGTNVQQYESNNSNAQQWEIRYNSSDNTYYLISKCNYLYADIVGARKENGTNVQMYTGNGTYAQKYIFTQN